MEKNEIEEAQKLLQQKENENFEGFQKEYQSICEKFGFQMSPTVSIKPNEGVVCALEIVRFVKQ